MGPTASGKTDLAVQLCKRFPCDVISVDSALVYRGMDIGTAKPDAQLLRRVPHELVDIRDPEDSYSAGEFVSDANAAIETSTARGRVPLLVGGTMMYFKALTDGLADLPPADRSVRESIDREAERHGWPHVHGVLAQFDPETAARLNPNDRQRIQRAVEVYRVSGRSLTDWQKRAPFAHGRRYLEIGLQIEPRSLLHRRIERRLDGMFSDGLVEEVRTLRQRPSLSGDNPAMRAVGYRQVWKHLDGEYDLEEARNRTLFATRQLAKRQLTWLRSRENAISVDALEDDAVGTISSYLIEFFFA